MKKWAAPLLAVSLLFILLAPGVASARGRHHARFHSHVFVGVGPWWGPPWWGSPWSYYPPPYYIYSPPPTVVVEQPPVYIQQQSPPPAPAVPAAESDWYYCSSAGAYYPSVQTCPEAWIRVPPRQ